MYQEDYDNQRCPIEPYLLPEHRLSCKSIVDLGSQPILGTINKRRIMYETKLKRTLLFVNDNLSHVIKDLQKHVLNENDIFKKNNL